MNHATFWFDFEYDNFLPPDKRGVEFSYPFNGNPTLKHLVEALRIPHTEIGPIVVNENPGRLTDKAQNGDVIRVYSMHHTAFMDGSEAFSALSGCQPRFILDNHLGRLATYLRMLGFDTLYRNDYQDDELAELAFQEQRILLTRDRGLLMRRIIESGYYVRSMLYEKQVVEVLKRYSIYDQIRPFQRCLRCNEPLVPVDKANIQERLEPLTKQYYDEFHLCPRCDRIYWKGSHYERMQNIINGLLSIRGE
jgi:uncharacterized protein with PIN domain